MAKSIVPEHLKVIDGGKAPVISPRQDPTDPFSNNWLDELDNGTVFVYRDSNKHGQVFLDHAYVKDNSNDHITQLLFPTGEVRWVDSRNFSSAHDLLHYEEFKEK